MLYFVLDTVVSMTLTKRKIAVIAGIGVGGVAALTVALLFVMTPIPAFANASPLGMLARHFGGGNFGPWQGGPGVMMGWQAWHNQNSYYNMMGLNGNQSKANWTGTVSVQSLRSGVMTGIIDTLKSKVKVDIVDAGSSAEKALGSGGRLGAISLAPVNGYLVYQAYGIDSSNNIHRLIIDVGNGNILADTRVDLAGSNISGGVGPWSSH
jgi:hypothetical protein